MTMTMMMNDRMKTRISNVRGFSLVELMLALVLSLFLLGGLFVTYISSRNTAQDAETLSRIQENMRFASDHLIRDVRNAGFRDQLTLTFFEFAMIGQRYAAIDDSALVIRYAGRTHCAQSRQDFDLFDELGVVENRYFVDANGNLACEGRIGQSTDGVFSWGGSRTVALATGLTNVSFQFLPDDAAEPCNFLTDDDLETACVGVRITADFQGIDPGDVRTAVMQASFRNVIVDRVYGR